MNERGFLPDLLPIRKILVDGVEQPFVRDLNFHTGFTVSVDETTGVITVSSTAGTTPTGTGFTHITAGAQDAAAKLVENADVSATAAIALSKLAPGTNAQLMVTNVGGTAWVGVSMSGDATITAAGAITVAKVNGTSVPAGGALTTGHLPRVTGASAITYGYLTDTNVDAAAAIAGTKVAPDFGSQNIVTTGTLGAGPATIASGADAATNSGLYITRVGAGSVLAGPFSSTFDAIWFHTSVPGAANFAFLGNQTVTQFNSGGQFYWSNSGAVWMQMLGSSLQVGAPTIGYSSAYGSVNGIGTQAMADANQTPAAAVYQCTGIATTGALTASRTLTLPTATDAQGYAKWINNQCTGAFGIVVKCAAGTTVTVANGMSAWVWIDSRGVTRMTADV